MRRNKWKKEKLKELATLCSLGSLRSLRSLRSRRLLSYASSDTIFLVIKRVSKVIFLKNMYMVSIIVCGMQRLHQNWLIPADQLTWANENLWKRRHLTEVFRGRSMKFWPQLQSDFPFIEFCLPYLPSGSIQTREFGIETQAARISCGV